MRITLLALALSQITVAAAAQQPLRVGPITASPGTTEAGTIEIAPRAGDQGTSLPITVINGAKPGPVLALIAGTHGMEYTPILALQRLRGAIDPKTLAGAVIMVHVANMPSYLGRTIYYSPADGKNLNRVFPGKADGTLSERIADVITREVIERATHVIDIHCGDGNESLMLRNGCEPEGPWNLGSTFRGHGLRTAVEIKSSSTTVSLIGTGAIIGLVVAGALSRYAGRLLFEIERWDPASFGIATAALALVSLAAAWIPASRASNVAPSIALREG